MRLAMMLLAGEHDSDRYWAAVDEADQSDIAEVLKLTRHERATFRREAVMTLPHLTPRDPPAGEMVDVVVDLTLDGDRRVRDYACFVLAQQWQEMDTPAVRDALAARRDDIDREARSESAWLTDRTPARSRASARHCPGPAATCGGWRWWQQGPCLIRACTNWS